MSRSSSLPSSWSSHSKWWAWKATKSTFIRRTRCKCYSNCNYKLRLITIRTNRSSSREWRPIGARHSHSSLLVTLPRIRGRSRRFNSNSASHSKIRCTRRRSREQSPKRWASSNNRRLQLRRSNRTRFAFCNRYRRQSRLWATRSLPAWSNRPIWAVCRWSNNRNNNKRKTRKGQCRCKSSMMRTKAWSAFREIRTWSRREVL